MRRGVFPTVRGVVAVGVLLTVVAKDRGAESRSTAIEAAPATAHATAAKTAEAVPMRLCQTGRSRDGQEDCGKSHQVIGSRWHGSSPGLECRRA